MTAASAKSTTELVGSVAVLLLLLAAFVVAVVALVRLVIWFVGWIW